MTSFHRPGGGHGPLAPPPPRIRSTAAPGGAKGTMAPAVPVKTNHKKDGRHPQCLIFYVFCPIPPTPDHPGSDAAATVIDLHTDVPESVGRFRTVMHPKDRKGKLLARCLLYLPLLRLQFKIYYILQKI